jgi:hypothetical protein
MIGHGIKSAEESVDWTALFRQLISGERLSVLDVGCGTGKISLMLAGIGDKVNRCDFCHVLWPSDHSGPIEDVVTALVVRYMQAASPDLLHIETASVKPAAPGGCLKLWWGSQPGGCALSTPGHDGGH